MRFLLIANLIWKSWKIPNS